MAMKLKRNSSGSSVVVLPALVSALLLASVCYAQEQPENGLPEVAQPATERDDDRTVDQPQPPAQHTREQRLINIQNEGLLLNFQDAPINTILNYLSETAGLIIIKDVEVDGRFTVVSRQPLSLEEAITMLNSVLKEKGFTAIRMGRTLRIVRLESARLMSIPVRSGTNPEDVPESDDIITQVIPLRHTDARQLREDLAPLIPEYAQLSANQGTNSLILTDTSANIRRIMRIIRALDTHLATVSEVRVFRLKQAEASSTADLINSVFRTEEAQRATTGREAAIARFRGREAASTDEEGARQVNVNATADQRTNTVVVTGPPDVLTLVADLVEELDADPTEEQGVFVYKLKNAQAARLETVLNNIFERMQQAAVASRGQAVQQPQRGRRTTQQTVVGAGVGGTAYVVADEDTNSLLVFTAPDNYERVAEIIAELDKHVPQVLIKVLIAEVTHDGFLDLGVEFSAINLRPSGRSVEVLTNFGIADEASGFFFRLLEESVVATLRALEAVGELEILSRPYILTSDNQTATITVGQQVPFVRETRTTEGGQNITTITYEDVGIILQVTPHINPDGLVIMDVRPEISSLTESTVPISELVSAPIFAMRSAESRIGIQDGQTVVIGGLVEDRKSETIRRVPILGRIPLLGVLFRRTMEEERKTELLIFITPHVAENPTIELEALSLNQLERSRSFSPGSQQPRTFQEHLDAMKR